MHKVRVCLLSLFTVLSFVPATMAADVPAVLPRPDDAAPASDKPVKVYILAGQSNMVGFGTLKGARSAYPSIFLSADPAVMPGRMPVGDSGLLPLSVFPSAKADAAPGATVALYKGEYDPNADYSKRKPVKETSIAFGTVSEILPTLDGPHTVVATTYVEVPMSGNYFVHPGFASSTHAIATLDGNDVYRKESKDAAVLNKVALERGKRYPVTITYLKGGSCAFWMERVDLPGKGDLETIIADGKFPWFVDEAGNWTVRNDVTYWDVRLSKKELGSGGPLTVTSNGRFMGPEVPFGYVMGTYHDEPVLVIESSIGNRSLIWDYRPPSSGRTKPDNKYEGYEYRHMVKGVHKVLENLDKVVPDYQGQGYEIAGFVWWQGHKDKGTSKAEYEENLVNLINDVRQEFDVPDMPAAVATVGFHGYDLPAGWEGVLAAQMAVGDPKQHPAFAGTVASVDTRGFWRSQGDSPAGVDYHYNKNAETYALTGDALGRAMVGLLGGEAEAVSLPPSPARDPNVEWIFSGDVLNRHAGNSKNPTPAQYREMSAALKPILFEKMIPAFVEKAFSSNSRRLKGLELKGIASGEKPKKMPGSIESQLDTLVDYYEMAGIEDYGWKPLKPGMKTADWYYYSFDPPEKQDLAQSDRYREITFPEGMENWYGPEFDPEAAGWKKGQAPFGQWDGKLEARRPRCNGPVCGCSEKPATLWEKEVLLMRQTFELPAVKDGHAYRVILGGAGCDRSGEGYAIYVNGKLLRQQNGGFFRHPGIRGAYLYADILPEFKDGKVTIAVINFLRYTHFRNKTTYFGPRKDYYQKTVPPNGQVSLWIEEAKLSPEILEAAQSAAE